MSRVLNVILAHQPAPQVEKLLRWWSVCSKAEDILIAYGGTLENFKSLPDIPRFYVDDPRLRVRDLQRDRQSYGGIWRGTAACLASPLYRDHTHIYFAEYDHLPLIPDLAAKLVERLQSEKADVLAHHLRQVDGTNSFFYLYHISDPGFNSFWERISVRADKRTVLQMHGSASFWTREAFLNVAAQPEEIEVYTELYLPTVAHHLGFRVRDFGEQNDCVQHAPSRDLSVEIARQKGSWTVHPVKSI